jgi:DNA repair photolyase
MAERGRGADENPANHFQRFHVETDEDAWIDEDAPPMRTTFLHDDSQSILVRNEASDILFEYGLNAYRGCEHGCAYCYARRYHEYLGFSAGLDFETKIIVKPDAPELLEKALLKRSYKPGIVGMSGVTDCYQPVERRLQLTRRCLEVCARFRQPVVIITKNALVTRDVDHLAELARYQAIAVYLSVTTLDAELGRKLEPRASSPRARLEAIRTLHEAGVPAGVIAAPMIPGLTDTELPAILNAAKDHGASFAAYSLVRLPGTVAEVFASWLERTYPGRKTKILNRIRAAYEGELNSTSPGLRNRGGGAAAGQLRAMFHATCRRLDLPTGPRQPSVASFRRVDPGQGELF